jgi:hypothetical protein
MDKAQDESMGLEELVLSGMKWRIYSVFRMKT